MLFRYEWSILEESFPLFVQFCYFLECLYTDLEMFKIYFTCLFMNNVTDCRYSICCVGSNCYPLLQYITLKNATVGL